MPSTAIRLISYDDTTQRLSVTFVTGRSYIYENVPEQIYRDFLMSESKGRYFNENIRDLYDYRELPRRQRNRSAA